MKHTTETPALPNKKYNIIYADPPWSYKDKGCNGHFFGLGRWTRGNSEPCLVATKGEAFHLVLDEEGSAPCLIATKGKPKRISASVGQLVFSPLRTHSQKPDEVRDRIVELMGDLPRVELFARSAAEGWDCWGNEAPTQQEEDDAWML